VWNRKLDEMILAAAVLVKNSKNVVELK
jgi:hypothetical protein